MFSSVLVANRGEIACRVFRTARELGLRAIAVYSDADAAAKHVREADVAVRLGPAPASESYLRGDAIIAAAKATGAEAIHPGYGFLSENPDFAEAVIAAGLIWIGPTPAAIRAMGLKDEAKRIAIEAGVPVLPGYQGEDQSEKHLLKAAKDIGFPVLIKAVAGGGGRGIREVNTAEEFKDLLASAQREAKAAFGDDRVLIEKLVARPRHIEVQVFGDKHGGLVHLFERDCSLQRRRQKVIEEAPAPGMSEEVRAAMTAAALKVARAVAYENAGTVEFIVDGTGPLRPDGFWFLEMNTRLQVEHPVTETVTGLDLVAWQFKVAAGERLPLNQDSIRLDGCAVEVRLCAEDPGEAYRPSVGRITRFDCDLAEWWTHRLDSGFEGGDVVSPHYDSLLAKLVVRDPLRSSAFAQTMAQLSELRIAGVRTNAGLLYASLSRMMVAEEHRKDGLFDDPAWSLHTGLLAAAPELAAPPAWQTPEAVAAIAAIAGQLQREQTASGRAYDAADGWRLNAPGRIGVRLSAGGDAGLVIVEPGPAAVVARAGQTTVRAARADAERVAPGVWRLSVGGASDDLRLVLVWFDGPDAFVNANGWTHPVQDAEAHAGDVEEAGGDEVKAPLPGKIVALAARPGQAVAKGEALATLEAMKMEHALKAPRAGVVEQAFVAVGDQVKEGAVLVRLAAEAAS